MLLGAILGYADASLVPGGCMVMITAFLTERDAVM